jgi:hypothetical protein
MNVSVSTISRRITATKTGLGQIEGLPRKPCAAASKGCPRTLSARSKFKECQSCRDHERKWGDASIELDDIERLYHRAELSLYRFGKHLVRKVSTVQRKRA